MTTGVVERTKLVICPPDQENAGAADLDCPLAAGLGEIVRTSDAHPRSREEVATLPLKNGARLIGLGGKSAGVVERSRTGPESLRVYGRHIGHLRAPCGRHLRG
jgi:hypothetical protein